MKAQKESDIQNSILDYLHYRKIFCWRNNSVGVYDAKNKSFRRLPKYAINGVSDILGILPDGRFLGIEVKKKGSYPSLAQKDFMANILERSGIAFIAHSIDEVESRLRDFGY